jgi:hypothetical protein
LSNKPAKTTLLLFGIKEKASDYLLYSRGLLHTQQQLIPAKMLQQLHQKNKNIRICRKNNTQKTTGMQI